MKELVVKKIKNVLKSFSHKKTILVLCALVIFHVFDSKAFSQLQSINLKLQNVPLSEAIQAIEKQSKFKFAFNNIDVDVNKRVTINVVNKPLREVVSDLFPQYTAVFNRNNIIVISNKQTTTSTTNRSSDAAHVQGNITPKIIRGQVADAVGETLIGVNIVEVGTTNGTITDVNGNYTLAVSDEQSVLRFSYVGFQDREVTVGRDNVINLTLTEQAQELDEVVIVGFGTQRKVTVTGAVSSMSEQELLKSPQANISNSLVGRLPGLIAVQRSGQPGESQSTIRIRGVGTFNGSADPLVMVDGIEGINYNNIDPSEIESISILKDASSTAVYGVRGANGVVLITTKRGAETKPKIRLSSNVAFNTFTNIRRSVSAYDYALGYNEARKYDSYLSGGYNPAYTAEQIEKYRTGEDPIFYPNTDWFRTMYKDFTTQSQHNLNISGGSKKIKYFSSVGYYNEQGMFSKNITSFIKDYDAQPRFTRYNFRTNLDFEITKNFSIGFDISSQTEERKGNTTNINRLIEIVTKANPTISPGIVDDKLITLGVEGSGGQTPHTLMLVYGYTRDSRTYLNGTVNMRYKLDFVTPGLSAKAKVSYLNFNRDNRGFSKNPLIYLPIRTDNGDVVYVPQNEERPFTTTNTISKFRREYVEYGLDYNRMFGNHTLGALLLYNQNKLYDPTLLYMVPRGYQGIVGRITYDYKNKYLLEYNLGYNGTENFGEGKRFGFFPAYSIGWVPTNEDFFPKNDIISFMKLRGSYGEVGNDQVGGERFLYRPSSYSYTDNYYYFGEVGRNLAGYRASIEGKIGNPDLTWERARKLNVGVDLHLLDSKLRMTADWFREKRDNILANLGTIPTLVGANLPAYNLGKMRNSGYDIEASFNNSYEKLNYWLRASYTYAHNVIEFMDEPTMPYPYLQATGQRAGQFFGLIAEGFYNTWEEVNDPNRPVSAWNTNKLQPGDIKYRDVNGDGIINSYDYVPIGYSNFPEIIYSFSLGGDFKGFDLSVLFQGAGNVSVNYSRHARYGYREGATVPDYILEKSWSQERYEQGLPIDFPHLSEGDGIQQHNYTPPSSMWIRNSSYLRLKNIDLGYTFGKQLNRKLGISSIRVFANANNLFTWSEMLPGVDPESNVASTNYEPYPLVKTINFGMNINF